MTENAEKTTTPAVDVARRDIASPAVSSEKGKFVTTATR